MRRSPAAVETHQRVSEFLNYVVGRAPIEIPDTDRGTLAELLAFLGMREGAEVGVETGKYSDVLLQANPGLRLHLVDAWAPYSGYREHVTVEKLTDLHETCLARLAPYRTRIQIHRGWSVDMARGFKNESLDFVYIDANHTLPHVIADLAAWEPKVRRGGIVAGHDFLKRKENGYHVHVVEAVHAWTSAYHIDPWFVLGRKDVVEGEKRDRPRSWFWVKE